MDTSEQYIKMCEKAEEVQNLRCDASKWEEGDFHTVKGWGREAWVTHHEHLPECIWLPRQDQLQEMVREFYNPPWQNMNLLHNFYDWAINYICDANANWTKTMEQLWLAFVMKEKYNKVWNGEDWSNHAIL